MYVRDPRPCACNLFSSLIIASWSPLSRLGEFLLMRAKQGKASLLDGLYEYFKTTDGVGKRKTFLPARSVSKRDSSQNTLRPSTRRIGGEEVTRS